MGVLSRALDRPKRGRLHSDSGLPFCMRMLTYPGLAWMRHRAFTRPKYLLYRIFVDVVVCPGRFCCCIPQSCRVSGRISEDAVFARLVRDSHFLKDDCYNAYLLIIYV